MKTIKLTKGKETIVDDEDFERFGNLNWYASITGYAVRNITVDKKQKTSSLHRMILGAQPGQMVDHINGDPLDNQKSNLRFCTRQENNRNRRRNYTTASRYKGVWLDKENSKWVAYIGINHRLKHLGRFKSKEDAARAYNEAAIKFFGEFARLNEIKTEDNNHE